MSPLHDSYTCVEPKAKKKRGDYNIWIPQLQKHCTKTQGLTTPQSFSETNSHKQVWTRSLFSVLSCRSEPAGLILMICGCHSNQFSKEFSNLWFDGYLNRVERSFLPSTIAWGSSQIFTHQLCYNFRLLCLRKLQLEISENMKPFVFTILHWYSCMIHTCSSNKSCFTANGTVHLIHLTIIN